MAEVYTFADLEDWGARSAADTPVRLGLFGHPVAHSLSPKMQDAALQHCGLQMRYAAFDITPHELPTALRLLPALGFVGVNLTIPHKISAAAVVDELDGFAQRVGAINTVRVEGEKLVGLNTDGPGFAHAIRSEFSVNLRDLRVLLLGAGGGAGRAIAMQCAAERCKRLVLVNRTHDKAQKLAEELKPSFAEGGVSGALPRLQAVPWEEQVLRFQIAQTDLIVNATSVGLNGSDPPLFPPSLLAPHLMIYDAVYTAGRTPLLDAAIKTGARSANGFAMLLHQGALSFEHWFGRTAPLEVMRAALSL